MAGAHPAASVEAPGLRVLVTAETDAEANLALEEKLLLEVEADARPDTLRLWIANECIVRGPNRSGSSGWHDEELARQLGIRVYTRTTGGGSVYFDPGNLNWSFYLRRTEGFVGARKLFRACAAVIVESLRTLGIDATFALPNRLDVAGRKISGMASRASLGAVLIHGTLLVSTDLDRLNALCIPPPGCPRVARLCDFDPRLTVAAVGRGIARSAEDLEVAGKDDNELFRTGA
jgi:lipoate-protein ligase A